MRPQQQDHYVDDDRRDAAPYIPRGARSALDVGCGPGGFGRSLRGALGAEARIVGVEAMETSAARARVGHGYDEVVRGYFPEALDGRADRFDLVTFIDVLEHLVDPWAALAAARDRLEPGGRVLALVPNIQVWYILGGLLRGRWDYADQGTLDRTHLRFFTKATMIELFEGAGLDVELIRGVNDVSSGRRLRDYRRSAVKNLEWLPRVVPDSRWLHFVVMAGVHAAERPASD